MSTAKSITGRDGYVAASAFAIAIEVIRSLPEGRQQPSSCWDMIRIFEACFSEDVRRAATASARFHLFPDAPDVKAAKAETRAGYAKYAKKKAA